MNTNIKTTVAKVHSLIEVEQKVAIIKALRKQAELEAFMYYIATAIETAINNDTVISTIGCKEIHEKLLLLNDLKGNIGDVWCKLAESDDFEEWWDSSNADGSYSYELELFAAKLNDKGIENYKTHVNEAKATISDFDSEKQLLKGEYDKAVANNVLMFSRSF